MPTRCTRDLAVLGEQVGHQLLERAGRLALSAASASASGSSASTKEPAESRNAETASVGNGLDADRPQAAARRVGALVGGEHAGGEQRAHVEAVEQAAATGEVLHQLGVVLGELAEVGRDAVAVERVGLDEAGADDRAAERDLGSEVADGAARDGAERLVGRLLELVDPAVGQHRGAYDERVGVELDRAGQQAVLARRGARGCPPRPGPRSPWTAHRSRRRRRRRGSRCRAGRGCASRCRRSRTGRPAPASGRTCRPRRTRRTPVGERLVVGVRGMSRSLIAVTSSRVETWASTGASSVARSSGSTRATETRAPSSWRGVRECQPSLSSTHETTPDRGGGALGDLGGEDAEPAAALGVDGGHGGGGLGLAEGLAVGADRRPRPGT